MRKISILVGILLAAIGLFSLFADRWVPFGICIAATIIAFTIAKRSKVA